MACKTGEFSTDVLGILRPVLTQRWVDPSMEHPENPFPGNGNARDAEMQRIMRENRRLKEDNEILKKAVGIFTNAQK